MPTANSQHLAALTWLRGIAAFFVIISHSLRATEDTYLAIDQPVEMNLLSVFDLGTFGVLLFFTLSGTTLYLSNVRPGREFKLTHFYLKRVFRIWPAYLFSLFFYALFALVFRAYYGEPQGNWIERQYLADYQFGDLLSYLSLSFNIFSDKGLFNNAYWSLPVEFQYYVIFPLIIWSLTKIKMAGPVLIAGLAYLIYKLDLKLFNDDRVFLLAFTFCFGVLLGYLYRHSQFRFNRLLANLSFFSILLFCAGLSTALIHLPDLPGLSNIWLVLGLAAVSCVALVIFGQIVLPEFITKPFFKYGEISYSVYLYHNLFIGLAVLLLIQLEIEMAWLRLTLVLLLGGVVSSYLASLSYTYIELPFIQLAKRLTLAKTSGG